MGWHFIGIKHMSEIERNACIGAVDFFKRQEGCCDIRHEAKRAWLVGLILNGDINRGIVTRHFIHRGNGVIPCPRIIDLERIVETILSHPKRHQISTRFGQRIQATLCDVNRVASYLLIRMGKRAKFKTGIGVIAHRIAI